MAPFTPARRYASRCLGSSQSRPPRSSRSSSLGGGDCVLPEAVRDTVCVTAGYLYDSDRLVRDLIGVVMAASGASHERMIPMPYSPGRFCHDWPVSAHQSSSAACTGGILESQVYPGQPMMFVSWNRATPPG